MSPPIPRRLVGESLFPPGLSPAYSGPSENVPKTRLACELGKVGTGAQAGLRFCRLPVRPPVWPGQTDTGPLAEPSGQNTRNIGHTGLSGPAVHVPDRVAYSHRETSSPRPPSHAAHTVAPQKQLKGSGITRKGDPHSQVLAPAPTMVARRKECSHRSAFTPFKTFFLSAYILTKYICT